MDREQLDKILLFDGSSDLTFKEIEAWRKVMFNILGANKLYVEKMRSAVDVLSVFEKLDDTYDNAGKNSMGAAERISSLLSKMANLHHDVYGDFANFTSSDGPFSGIMGVNEKVFVELKNKADKGWKDHEKLEKASVKAWKRYVKKEKRREMKEKKLSKKMLADDMILNKQYATFKRKAEIALIGYNHCHDEEVENRQKLQRQSVTLKKEFLKEEKGQLEKMFAFINDSLQRLQKLAPQGIIDTQDLDFSPVGGKVRTMAKRSWERNQKEHAFPKKMERSQISKTKFSDDSEDDSDESDSEDDMSDNTKNETTYTPVQSLQAPKLSHQDLASGIGDALKEINEDIDNEPPFLRLRDSPEPRRPLFTPNPDYEPAQDRPMTPDSLDGGESGKAKSKVKANGAGPSGSGVKSESRRRRRASKLAKEEGEQRKTSKAVLPPTDKDDVVYRSNVEVYVVKDYEKKNSKELTIRRGMSIKQKRCADNNGMAYGYKRTKMGLKKYGFYPGLHVSLEAPEEGKL